MRPGWLYTPLFARHQTIRLSPRPPLRSIGVLGPEFESIKERQERYCFDVFQVFGRPSREHLQLEDGLGRAVELFSKAHHIRWFTRGGGKGNRQGWRTPLDEGRDERALLRQTADKILRRMGSHSTPGGIESFLEASLAGAVSSFLKTRGLGSLLDSPEAKGELRAEMNRKSRQLMAALRKAGAAPVRPLICLMQLADHSFLLAPARPPGSNHQGQVSGI